MGGVFGCGWVGAGRCEGHRRHQATLGVWGMCPLLLLVRGGEAGGGGHKGHRHHRHGLWGHGLGRGRCVVDADGGVMG